ncbi:hypothetical protein ACPYO6_12815 [Georgenia sp. Z1344]|uniref:hypothetical protein n=1 Tax=Georgenia sp. Z1344 TaxID=3416706 RepID=UPI003CF4743A
MDHEIPWSGRVHERGAALENGGWGAAASADVGPLLDAMVAGNLFGTLKLLTIS